MNSPRLQLRGPQTARLNAHYQKPLGQVLVDKDLISHDILLHALSVAEQVGAPVEHVLLAEGYATDAQIVDAQADRFAAIPIFLEDTPPDRDCCGMLDPAFCLEHKVWPWIRLGNTLVIATSDPDNFEAVAELIPADLGTLLMGVARARDIEKAIAQTHGRAMAEQAERDVPDAQSCRNLHILATRRQTWLFGVVALLLAGLVFVEPGIFFALLASWAIVSLLSVALMKTTALVARILSPAAPSASPHKLIDDYPVVSLLVPLFQETDIAGTLVKRLSQLTYPKARLEALLVLEAEDLQTRKALSDTKLPPWMRVITVPPGALRTKPRAMNYARRFARGDILGIYDAEDAPAPNQIEAVVAHFARAGEDVACLQGVLDYYNPTANWLARCFTIEYAAWFRILLPGLARVGMPIPLGGTTVFFRRAALEELHGWDAHNVTEDADLGMRLARAGYRTELVDSVTLEEANCRFWPWVRQRSRWLKGYLITYAVNMRRPRALLRDFGWKRFAGFQILFLATLSQFALAPIMWSFWLVLFGWPHPIIPADPGLWFTVLTGFFLASEMIGLVVGIAAVASPQHRHLVPWVPTLLFYFPLGTLAIAKAIAEALHKPFYWDKTSHGHALGAQTLDHGQQ